MKDTIWFATPTLDMIRDLQIGTLDETLGIIFTEIGPDFICARMPAEPRIFQPTGRVHGGANVVLAESLGSVGANMVVDPDKYFCLGQEINANHLRGVSAGKVNGTARPVHIGRSSQVWEIRMEDDAGKLTCISRLTMAVVSK